MSKIFKNINKKMLSMALILTFGMGINNVYAACNYLTGEGCNMDLQGTGDSTKIGVVDTGDNSGYENSIVDSVPGLYSGLYGIRISVVNKFGQTITENSSRNYYSTALRTYLSNKEKEGYTILNYNTSEKYGTATPRTYTNAYSDNNWNKTYPIYTYTLKSLDDKFNRAGFKTNFQNNVSNLNLQVDTMFSSLYKKNYSGKFKYESALLLSIQNLTGESPNVIKKIYYDEETGTFNLFILYEPLTAIEYYDSTPDGNGNVNKKIYVGTTYELAQFLYNHKSSGLNGIKLDENGNNILGAFAELGFDTSMRLGCSVYITSSLYEKMQPVAKDLGLRYGFTSSSYFYHKLYVKNNISSICSNIDKNNKWQKIVEFSSGIYGVSSASLNNTRADSSAGVGIGILWFGDLNSDLESCDDLNKELEKDYPGFTTLAVSDINDSMFTKYNKKNNKQWTAKTYLDACPRTMSCDTINSTLGITPYITLEQAQNYATQLKNYGMTPSDYCSVCGCSNKEIKYDCTPRIDTANCDSGESTIYSDANGRENDQDYWNYCVFNDIGYYTVDKHKTSSDFKDSTLGSDYCEVYCIEDLSVSLAKGKITALAGRYFTLPDSTISGSRTCKTKSINYTQYETDIKKDKTDIDKAISDLNAVISFNNSLSSGHWGKEKENKSSTLKKIDKNFNTQEVIDDGSFNGPAYKGQKVTTFCFKNDSGGCQRQATDGTWCDAITGNDGAGCYVNVQGTSSYTYTWVNSDGNEYTLPILNNPQNISLTKTVDSKITNTTSNSPSGYNISDYKNKLNDAIKNRDNHIENMKKCYTWDADKIYQTNATVEITYNFDAPYTISGHKLQSSVLEDNLTPNLDCTDTTVDKYTYSCGSTGCVLKPTNEPMKKCSTVTMNRYILNAYDADTFEYIEKSTKSIYSYTEISRTVAKNFDNNFYTIFKTITKTTESEKITNYIKIDIPNFPVSFSLKPGPYNYELKSSNLGHNTSSAKLDEIIGQNDRSYSLLNCSIEIKEGLFRNNENTTENTKCVGTGCGLNIIYREIDLARPFPNIDNSNRNTGSNWCSGVSCSWDNGVVQRYILNNRNVTGSEIYNQTPMYTFIMKPDDILKIRKYNDSNSYENYTGTDATGNYDYKCNEGTGEACISGYLTHLLDILEGNNLPGTCKDARTRAYTDVTSFNNCRYETD